jgi:hypothetical protein
MPPPLAGHPVQPCNPPTIAENPPRHTAGCHRLCLYEYPKLLVHLQRTNLPQRLGEVGGHCVRGRSASTWAPAWASPCSESPFRLDLPLSLYASTWTRSPAVSPTMTAESDPDGAPSTSSFVLTTFLRPLTPSSSTPWRAFSSPSPSSSFPPSPSSPSSPPFSSSKPPPAPFSSSRRSSFVRSPFTPARPRPHPPRPNLAPISISNRTSDPPPHPPHPLATRAPCPALFRERDQRSPSSHASSSSPGAIPRPSETTRASSRDVEHVRQIRRRARRIRRGRDTAAQTRVQKRNVCNSTIRSFHGNAALVSALESMNTPCPRCTRHTRDDSICAQTGDRADKRGTGCIGGVLYPTRLGPWVATRWPPGHRACDDVVVGSIST